MKNSKNSRYNWVVVNSATGKMMRTPTQRRAIFKTRKEARQFASTRPFGRVMSRAMVDSGLSVAISPATPTPSSFTFITV